MPHPATLTKRGKPAAHHSPTKTREKSDPRYTVALNPKTAKDVKRYAHDTGSSMSKAIATLVRVGLENQGNRKREFFQKLKENLANDDPKQQDRLVDEFRALILGR